MSDLVAALRELVAADAVVPGDAVESRYLGDWQLRDDDARPGALARPRTTAEIAAILRESIARRPGRGARRQNRAERWSDTAGWLDHRVALERMNAIGAADTDSATIVVEAGAVLQSVQKAAADAGMLFPLDIGGRGSCTIGGNISTNAGGNRVLRYGMMREIVLGLEAVLADGTVIDAMNEMLKNNTGYDLKQLFIGARARSAS